MSRDSDVGLRHHLSTTCCYLSKRRNQSINSHFNKSTETTATSDPHQQWKVPVKWIQTRTNNKKKLQVRSRFEALRTDGEDFPITDEYDDPGLSGTTAKKRHQGGMQNQTYKHRSETKRINTRDEGSEGDLSS